jgi:hypothetical protein
MASGEISSDLPEIKRLAMEILHGSFTDRDSSMTFIEEEVKAFYADNYPEVSNEKSDLISQAIIAMQEGFNLNIFPFMQVRWDVYPNHIGHLESIGCARCHDDKHVSNTGRAISRDCNLCHTISSQGTPGAMEFGYVYDSLEFKHPVDIDEMWKEFLCVECHHGMY